MNSARPPYLETLINEFGRSWNRFWFTPSDPIVLSALRIGAGLMALYLVALYTPDLDRYFGDHGLVPSSLLVDLEATANENLQAVPFQVREAMPRQYRFSYLDYIHRPGALLAAHAAGMVVVLLFTAGLFTRLTAIASLVVFLSYYHRGPMLTSGTESLVAILLFYLCLGPAGRVWSVDRWLARRRGQLGPAGRESRASTWATVALRLLQIHLTLIYVMMAVGKLGNASWWSGEGVWWLITKTESRMIDLTGLHRFPLVVNLWTYAVLFWQVLMPILVWNRLARPLLLAINAAMWLLLAPVIGNPPLALAMIVASLAFVSPDFFLRFSGPAPLSR